MSTQVVAFVYPGCTLLDLVGPIQVWSFLPNVEIQFVAKAMGPIATDAGGCTIQATHGFGDSFQNPDIFFIPGGAKPTLDLLEDARVLNFVSNRGARAGWVTSVCTGSLVLGAAGLLRGYEATTHWSTMGLLKGFGATPVPSRYVMDGNRATGAGVTAGIDFGLALMARIVGQEHAEVTQLLLEYAPAPPFTCGTPQSATGTVLGAAQRIMQAEIGVGQ